MEGEQCDSSSCLLQDWFKFIPPFHPFVACSSAVRVLPQGVISGIAFRSASESLVLSGFGWRMLNRWVLKVIASLLGWLSSANNLAVGAGVLHAREAGWLVGPGVLSVCWKEGSGILLTLEVRSSSSISLWIEIILVAVKGRFSWREFQESGELLATGFPVVCSLWFQRDFGQQNVLTGGR